MKLREIRLNMFTELKGLYPEKEASSLVTMLVENATGLDRIQAVIHDDRELSGEELEKLLAGLRDLKLHKPVQYITRKAWFCDLELEVNPFVLIPRPETEELVRLVMEENKGMTGHKILDLGTGSGCIIIALGKLMPGVQLTAVDNSAEALAVARKNAARHRVPVEFHLMDMLDGEQWKTFGKFELIISNPPYVRPSEKAGMSLNVLDYEPPEALFVPDSDPLVFYRAIAAFASQHLERSGKVYVEINENLPEETGKVFLDAGFTQLKILHDIHGKCRMISASGFKPHA